MHRSGPHRLPRRVLHPAPKPLVRGPQGVSQPPARPRGHLVEGFGLGTAFGESFSEPAPRAPALRALQPPPAPVAPHLILGAPRVLGSGFPRALGALAARPERIRGGPAKACEPKHTESRANKEAARPRANPEGRRPRGALLRCGSSPMHRSARIAFLAAPCIASPRAGVAPEILRGPEPLPDPRGTPPSLAPLVKAIPPGRMSNWYKTAWEAWGVSRARRKPGPFCFPIIAAIAATPCEPVDWPRRHFQ